MASALTLQVVPCGGLVNLFPISDQPGPWTIVRTRTALSGGTTSFTLPLMGPTTTQYLDWGDGENGPLSQTTTYTYTLTAGSDTVSVSVVPASAMTLEYFDFIALFVRVLTAGVASLVPPNNPAFKVKPQVIVSMPLTGNNPVPCIAINEDLLQQGTVSIGEDINTDFTNNEFEVYGMVHRRYRITVMTTTTSERDFYKNAIISLFKIVLIPILNAQGQDVRHNYQAASTQVTHLDPGFYICDLSLEFDGVFEAKVTTAYPEVEGFSAYPPVPWQNPS